MFGGGTRGEEKRSGLREVRLAMGIDADNR